MEMSWHDLHMRRIAIEGNESYSLLFFYAQQSNRLINRTCFRRGGVGFLGEEILGIFRITAYGGGTNDKTENFDHITQPSIH